MFNSSFLRSAILLCFLFVSSLTVHSAPVEGLYSGRVEVQNRDRRTFEAGLRQVLLQVLVKNSASSLSQIKNNPHLAGDLKNGHRYAQQFSYEVKTYMDDAGDEQKKLYLEAIFPESVITDFLQRGALSLWPASRPATLVIPVVKLDEKLSLHDKPLNESLKLDELVLQKAKKYGIAMLPAAQQRRVSTRNIKAYWYWNASSIKSGSAAIQKDAIFSGRIAITSNGAVRGGWLLIEGDEEKSVDIQAKSVEEFIDKGFLWLAQYWSVRDAINLQLGGNETVLSIADIQRPEDYAQLMKYLSDLDMVEKVYLLQADAQRLDIAVALKSDVDQFERALATGRRLMAQVNSTGEISYHWQSK